MEGLNTGIGIPRDTLRIPPEGLELRGLAVEVRPRDAGQLVCEIGLAPVKPAEFAIFRIGQMASGGGVEE